MLFCQFSKFNSLRDVCNGLKSASGNLNHLGLRLSPAKSSLSYQNKHRDWTVFKAYYFTIMGKLCAMTRFRQTRFKIKSKILLLDSTTIRLCLSLYDWAKFRKKKGALRLHTVLDYDGCLPVYMNMTGGKVHDAKAVKELCLPQDRHQHILLDEFITLSEHKTHQKYPEKLRRVVVWDQKNQQTLELI